MFENIISYLGDKKYRQKQLEQAIFRELTEDVTAITVFPKELRGQLANEKLFQLELADLHHSRDQKTSKALLKTTEGHLIETVLMRHKGRKTVCVSSQVGCPCACKFCATGAMGFIRNLSAQEIVEQVLFWARELKKEYLGEWNPKNPPHDYRVRNVVFMGMGEPLLNFEAVVEAIKTLNDDCKLGIGSRRITISTVGIIPQIKRLAEMDLQLNLAVSLHFPDNDLRSEIMPQNKIYPLPELMQTLWDFSGRTLRRIFFEYTVVDGVNDTLEMTHKLGKLLKGHLAHVNFIPLNENPDLKNNMKQGKIGKIRQMQKLLLEQYGIVSTIRTEFGGDIEGACGQLAGSAKM